MDIRTKVGREGERATIEFLSKQGYIIIETNWRYRRYEIDILCEKADTLVAVEVKTRTSRLYGEPETFVSRGQKKRIIESTQAYIEANHLEKEVRFDIIGVINDHGRYTIHHIPDAFAAHTQ